MSLCISCQNRQATARCTDCLIGVYCGESCQAKHWTQHKSECVGGYFESAGVNVPLDVLDTIMMILPLGDLASFYESRDDVKSVVQDTQRGFLKRYMQKNYPTYKSLVDATARVSQKQFFTLFDFFKDVLMGREQTYFLLTQVFYESLLDVSNQNNNDVLNTIFNASKIWKIGLTSPIEKILDSYDPLTVTITQNFTWEMYDAKNEYNSTPLSLTGIVKGATSKFNPRNLVEFIHLYETNSIFIYQIWSAMSLQTYTTEYMEEFLREANRKLFFNDPGYRIGITDFEDFMLSRANSDDAIDIAMKFIETRPWMSTRDFLSGRLAKLYDKSARESTREGVFEKIRLLSTENNQLGIRFLKNEKMFDLYFKKLKLKTDSHGVIFQLYYPFCIPCFVRLESLYARFNPDEFAKLLVAVTKSPNDSKDKMTIIQWLLLLRNDIDWLYLRKSSNEYPYTSYLKIHDPLAAIEDALAMQISMQEMETKTVKFLPAASLDHIVWIIHTAQRHRNEQTRALLKFVFEHVRVDSWTTLYKTYIGPFPKPFDIAFWEKYVDPYDPRPKWKKLLGVSGEAHFSPPKLCAQ